MWSPRHRQKSKVIPRRWPLFCPVRKQSIQNSRCYKADKIMQYMPYFSFFISKLWLNHGGKCHIQEWLHGIHSFGLVIICAKYRKNPFQTVSTPHQKWGIVIWWMEEQMDGVMDMGNPLYLHLILFWRYNKTKLHRIWLIAELVPRHYHEPWYMMRTDICYARPWRLSHWPPGCSSNFKGMIFKLIIKNNNLGIHTQVNATEPYWWHIQQWFW